MFARLLEPQNPHLPTAKRSASSPVKITGEVRRSIAPRRSFDFAQDDRKGDDGKGAAQLNDLNLEDTMRILNPPHPGDFIKTEIIEPLGLSVTAAAEVLGVSRPTLSTLLNGKADLSGDMALRIEKAFGPKMDTLMRMQSSFDIARTRRREGKIKVRKYARARAHA